MARIRTIKPEFPQSESVGAISREARLLFLQLFTVVDDEGRARAASRMLASLLYPYDDDAPPLVDGWLDELERGAMIRRYVVDGSTYLEIVKWLEHQKIDKPSRSRLPRFVEGSRHLAKPREASATDLGPRTLDQDHGGVVETRARAKPPKPEQIDIEEAIAACPLKPKGTALISAEAFEVSAEALTAVGKDPFDPISVGAPYTIQSWLNGGWNRDCILGGIKLGMQSRGTSGPPGTLKYFEKAIARVHAQLTQPAALPVVVNQPGETIHEATRNRPESLGQVASRLASAGISFGPKPKLIDASGRPTLEPVSEG